MQEIISLLLRISVMYAMTLAILRLSGKRSIGDLAPFDFLAGLIIGDIFDDIFWSEVPLPQGIVALVTILFLHTLVAYASYKSQAIHHLVSSVKTVMISTGQLVREGMRKERTREETVYEMLRMQMEDQEVEIREANLEPSGQLSVLKYEEKKPAEKKDLPQLLELFR